MTRKKRIFVSPSLIASLALSILETASRAMIETKLPLLNSAVAKIEIAFKRESRPKLCYVVLLQFPRFTRKFAAYTVHTVRGTSK